MEWIPSFGWPDGGRWVLTDGKGGTHGRVIRLHSMDMFVEAELWSTDEYVTKKTSTMKEAAEWLVKKVTTGTGAL
jgi:hypothetical protein